MASMAPAHDSTDATSSGQFPTGVSIKRQVNVKTIVTDQFKQTAHTDLSDEVQMIDAQLNQLEGQYQQSLQQLEQLAAQGQSVSRQMEQLNMEAQQRRHVLTTVRMDVNARLASLGKMENGSLLVTGQLESFVTLNVGDNIYDKVRKAEIIVRDGIIQAIHA